VQGTRPDPQGDDRGAGPQEHPDRQVGAGRGAAGAAGERQSEHGRQRRAHRVLRREPVVAAAPLDARDAVEGDGRRVPQGEHVVERAGPVQGGQGRGQGRESGLRRVRRRHLPDDGERVVGARQAEQPGIGPGQDGAHLAAREPPIHVERVGELRRRRPLDTVDAADEQVH
jgi:hypothetical protein